MIPSRWPRSLVWLLAVPGGALLGVLLSFLPKFHGLGAGATAAIGAGAGLLVAIVVLAMKWRIDARHDRVTARHPGAYVLDAGKVKGSMATLSPFGQLPPSTADSALTLAFADDGVHIHGSSGDASPIVSLDWSQIAGFGEGFASDGSRTRPAVVMDIRTDDGVVSFPFIVVTETFLYANANRVSRIRETLEGLRGASPVSVAYTTPHRRERLAGMSSRTWMLVSRGLGILGTVVVVGNVALTVVLSGGGVRSISIVPLAGVFVATLLLSVGALFLSARAERREHAAGYTLSRLGDVGVDQIDPKTGFVLRRAGDRQLTKQQEAAERRRTRELDLR